MSRFRKNNVPSHRTIALAVLLLLPLVGGPAFAAGACDLAFSTYFGGSAGEGVRDVEVDRKSTRLNSSH